MASFIRINYLHRSFYLNLNAQFRNLSTFLAVILYLFSFLRSQFPVLRYNSPFLEGFFALSLDFNHFWGWLGDYSKNCSSLLRIMTDSSLFVWWIGFIDRPGPPNPASPRWVYLFPDLISKGPLSDSHTPSRNYGLGYYWCAFLP